MNNQIQYLNPEGLFKHPAFSQIVTTQGNGKTIHIGGQDAIDVNGIIIGKGNIAEQTEQVMKNLQTALLASGATFENLVKLTTYFFERTYFTSQCYQSTLPDIVSGSKKT